MPPFRMPFTSRRPVATDVADENARPTSRDQSVTSPYKDKPSLALGIKEKRADLNEFKLSSLTNRERILLVKGKIPCHNGFQPPSMLQRQRTLLNLPRVFRILPQIDISGRSPILQADSFTSRSSLDSRGPSRFPTRSTFSSTTFEAPTKEEEGFEDVKLNEEVKPQQPKKKSFLSRFGDSSGENLTTKEEGKHHFHIPGRKRGQSGTGSELKDIPRPQSNGKAEVTVR
ncbi:hypothetical protein LTR11_004399 [Exophiala xenobiotica]|nr:hypothetical protein LTR11_004399 [Exophiala xenobiotica]